MKSHPKFVLLTVCLTICVSTLSLEAKRNKGRGKLEDLIGSNVPLEQSNKTGKRDGRLFSLFSIVTFKNIPCTINSDNTHMGTCMTSSECTDKGGNKDGNCAAGFGVCCSFTVNTCPGTVNQNCTYVSNPEYPAATTENSCQITFNRVCGNLCQIRLDFETMTMSQPDTTVDNMVGICGATNTDTLTVSSPTGKGPPVLCGDLTGQHMFFETGDTGTAGQIALSFGSLTSTRRYQFKVTYYTCDSLNKAPADCIQYFTGSSGNIQSYNYPTRMLAGMDYSSCIRQEQGFCGITYQEAISTTDTFNLFGAIVDMVGEVAVNSDCSQTYISVPNVDLSTLETAKSSERFCGQFLSSKAEEGAAGQILASGTPFLIRTFTMSTELGGAAGTATNDILGYSIDYAQIPCGTSNN